MVKRPNNLAGSVDLAILGLFSFVLGYGLLKASGLFSTAPGRIVRALHETPPQVALYLLMAALLARVILGDAPGGRRERLLLRTGIFMMACGLVVSSYVRFEGMIVLTEGQQFTGSTQEYVEGSLYSGKKASVPRFGFEARDVTIHVTKDGLSAEQVVLRAIYGNENGQIREVSIGSGLPWFDSGMFYRITRFGYSPLFRFTDAAGSVLQEFYWPLALFPPGAEDSLRSFWIPHVFYVKYYPEGEGAGGMHGGGRGPVLNLRIVRNIELLFQGTVRLNEPVRFESMTISFPEVRKWVEIKVVRDSGLLLFFAGCFVAVSAIVLLVLEIRAKRNGAAGRPGGPQL